MKGWTAIAGAVGLLLATSGCAAVDDGPKPGMVLGSGEAREVTGTDGVGLAAWRPDEDEHCPPLAKGLLNTPQTAAYARSMERTLAARGVDVALVFHQSGTPRAIMPANVRYVHGAIWVRQNPGAAGQPVYATYNLLPGYGTTPCYRSALVTWSAEDFNQNLTALDSAVIVPTSALQAKIRALVLSPAYPALHNPAFAVTANPLEERYQNCAGLILHVVVAAAWDVPDHVRINQIIRETFTPSSLKVIAPIRIFSPLVSSRTAADDQNWTVATASFESIDAFMKARALSLETFIFYFDPRPPAPSGLKR